MSVHELQALGIETRGRQTGQLKTLCPECSHTRTKKTDPCLSVNLDDGVYHCHNCGWQGVAGGDRRDSYGAAPLPRVYTRPTYQPSDTTPGGAIKWLGERGIPAEVARRNRIGAAEAWMPQRGGKVPAITFPYYRDGELINVKYRTLDKHFRMESGAELTLYGLGDIREGEPLIWTEGEIDKLSVEAAGYPAAVSVPNGAPSPSSKNYARHFEYLTTEEARLAGVSRHIIAVDNDEPGRVLKDELIRRLGVERCAVALWPEGCKDANDVLIKHGAAALADAIARAVPVPVAGLYEADDFLEDLYKLYAGGLDGGAHPGSVELARYYTVRPEQWTLVTGIPGHGKSAVLDWLMVNLAHAHGWRFAICSPENQPVARHIAQLAQIYIGKSFGARRDGAPRMDGDELEIARAWVQEHFYFIKPDDNATLEGVLTLARAAVLRYGVKGLVIDPWNEIDHSGQGGLREDQYISVALGRLRQWTRNNKVHTWLVAHPAKLQKDKLTGEYPVPTPYDVAGGAHFRNKADMALSVWRDVNDENQPTQVHIQKVRFRECGTIGVASLYHDKVTGRYHDRPLWEVQP